MNNFIQYTPTKVIFGRETEKQTGEAAAAIGAKRALIVFGTGSVKKSGLLERVEESLKVNGIAYEEFGGARPNPTLAHAEEGVKKALAFQADLILAVGGGSAIDTAKGIAHGAANPEAKLWELWTGKAPIKNSLPVGAVVTIAAAGSEMSDSAVLTNEEAGLKSGVHTEFNRCRFAIMNPELLFTLPKYQLAAGITDIMMHTMERYFIPGIKCDMTDEIAEGLLRTVIANAKIVMEKEDYDAMAEIMWCSSLSHNDITECGRGKDFSVHKIGMALSAMYDYTHGATLSAVWGAWARMQLSEAPERFARYARKVFGITEQDDLKAGELGIKASEEFWRSIGMPVSLQELGEQVPDEEAIRKLSAMCTKNDTIKLSRLKPLGQAEIEEIYRKSL